MEAKNLALVSLILGIVSVVFIFILPIVGLITGIIGVILGSKANKLEKTGMGTAGFVLSLIGLIICAIAFIIALACVGLIFGGVAALGGIV